ncbi:MAG: RNA-binding ATPase activator esf2 [Thelocarpon superellum]|nr:MAG: RNA-binding ATPase activator esf2 [Thelocarpon superellum]
MKATKLRSLLSPFGAINRIFLTPEDPSSHTARVRSGGNKKRSFTDGWVEFRNKADAKIVAETLNTRIIGGRKGSFYHDDVWNIRYLRGFKWHHLTEQIANENAARASRLRSEIAASRKEDREYVRNVERAKMMDGMQRKAAARRAREAPGPEEPEEGQGEKMERPERRERTDLLPQKKGYPRHFRQNQVKSKGQDLVSSQASESVQRVLSKIF